MIATLLLCSALFAADPAPAQVSVKVLVGTGDKSQTAEVEPWISKAVAEAGSPGTATSTGWIKLINDERRIYTSPQGGVIVHGNVSEKNGKYEVEINGCNGGPLEASVILNPGERRVVKLTDYPEPNNIFIALAFDAPAEDSITVSVVGTLRTGIVAIGSETTGTTITSKGVTWELDFGKNAELQKTAEKLDGKTVIVRGTLERRTGVEVKDRWIVTVSDLKATEGSGGR